MNLPSIIQSILMCKGLSSPLGCKWHNDMPKTVQMWVLPMFVLLIDHSFYDQLLTISEEERTTKRNVFVNY